MCVLEVKSTAWKPTRSIVGAIARMSARRQAGRAPEALVAVARRRVDDVDEPRAHAIRLARGRAARRTRRARAFSAHTSTIVPATPAGTEFIIFITSIRQTTVSRLDARADVDERRRPGRLGAVEGAEHRRRRSWRHAVRRAALRRRRPAARAALRRPVAASPHVEREPLGLDAELLDLGLVDQPEDLADVVVAQRHRDSGSLAVAGRRRTCPARATAPSRTAFGARSGTVVTGRAWSTTSASGSARPRAIAHSTSWWEPKWRSTRRATSTSAASCASPRHALVAPLGRHLDPHGAATGGVGHVLDVLRVHRAAHDLAGHLADQVVVRRHLAADDGDPEAPARVDRDHARVAAHRVAGEHHAGDLGVDHQLHRDAHRRRRASARRAPRGS